MARTITVNVDGQEFILASMTMDQVEEFWDDEGKREDLKQARSRIWKNIHYSIKNAGSDITLEDLKKITTFEAFQILRDKSLEVSGLLTDQGEAKATTTQTSNSSEVA